MRLKWNRTCAPLIAIAVMTVTFGFIAGPSGNFSGCKISRNGLCLEQRSVWEGVVETGEWRQRSSVARGQYNESATAEGKRPLLISRDNFPKGFVFGTATAAYQVEGAYKEDGRGLSVWDSFSHTPGKTHNGDTGDVACDQYHRYEEDIKLMVDLGVDAYRFSISWPRIYPNGYGEVNQKGIEHYNKLINALCKNGIKPFVTLYHWDLPLHLQETYGGWLGDEIVEHYRAYAETCFEAFGDRVKDWITFNEPLSFCVLGYGAGVHAPGRCSNRDTCPDGGNSATEPYICAHNVLRAHANTVKTYRTKYQKSQKGVIGITCDSQWLEPLTDSPEDKAAAQRAVEFQAGWYFDPIFFGDYPKVMREHLGDRLPRFSPEDAALIKGSTDFVGLNHYTSRYAANGQQPKDPATSNYYADSWVDAKTVDKDGKPIGPRAASEWLYIVPWGFGKLLTWITERYGSPPIYVTENGMDTLNNPSLPLEEVLNDTTRIQYYNDYLHSMSSAIKDGANVRGYFAWSLMDNFEWAMGYSMRFGIHFVDYKKGIKRYPKNSAKWWSEFLKR